ncbi:MAG: phosphodiester glycosidase family protein [Bacteroidia bacterium]|nr:phosphodiester glycosidase family protein [Bacteroidia bacterium]NNJ56797.1 hypothetical protein [Bacteroidia bacterium]
MLSRNKTIFIHKSLVVLLGSVIMIFSCNNTSTLNTNQGIENSNIVWYSLNPKSSNIKFFLKNDSGSYFNSIGKLKSWLIRQNDELIFAINGGMFKKDFSPLGLYIENGKVISKINNVREAYGNFYLQPNGVFSISKDKIASIVKTQNFVSDSTINFATQSGPLLLYNDTINPLLTKGSTNLHIRNGVGIKPNGELLFAMSKERINFYDFASFFKENNCSTALYLDGFVSRTYLPEKNWKQLDGQLGVLIGVVK